MDWFYIVLIIGAQVVITGGAFYLVYRPNSLSLAARFWAFSVLLGIFAVGGVYLLHSAYTAEPKSLLRVIFTAFEVLMVLIWLICELWRCYRKFRCHEN